MAYIINDACISCGACEAECPVECISPRAMTNTLSILTNVLTAELAQKHVLQKQS